MSEISEKEVEAALSAWNNYNNSGPVAEDRSDAMRVALEAAARVRAEVNREQAVPSGWKLVPEEPSDEMVEAVRKKQSEAGFSPDNSEWLRDNYSVMLSAAPAAPAAPTAGGGDA